ncbi:MAG TPA: S9 family peptidase, partial [Povalibacter sp.]|nr:S9 family peptidase [Povalibacter sp.]
GRLPAIGSAALSPDGKRLALSVGFEYQVAEPERELTALQIINIDTRAIEHTLTPPPTNTFRGVGWADDRRPFYYISAPARSSDALPSSWPVMFRGQRVEFWRTGVLSLDTGVGTLLMQDAEFRANFALANLQAPIEGDAGFGRMVAWSGLAVMNSVPKLAIYRVNLDNGKASATVSGNLLTRDYLLDGRGDIVARVDINERSDRWRLYTYEGDQARMVLEEVSEMGMPLSLFGLLADGRIAAVNPHEDGARDTLLAIDRKTGATSSLYNARGSDISALWDPWLRQIIGVSWTEDLPQQHFFDPQLEAIRDAVQPLFSGGYAKVQSWSRDRARILVFGERANDAGAWYIYELATKKLRIIGKLYPALSAPEHLGDRRTIQYKSRDGTRITGYLTLPVGVEPHNLPLVLLVHGGPHARDDFTFDWWSSFLASRGYAVLQANFRGSTGYGYDWFNAGRGGWGDGVMQTDVEDGAAALVRTGYVDASRVCIMGGSYGGYAALAGATLTPERYACAVSVNGLSDPEELLKHAENGNEGRRSMSSEWWRRSMGADDMAHLRKISPTRHAEQVRVPILILHGADDSVVPVEQSRAMSRKLRGAHKDVRYVELRGDDHWLSAASTRTQMLHEIETFLAEHLARSSEPRPAEAVSRKGSAN